MAGLHTIRLFLPWHGHGNTHGIRWHPHGIPWRGIGFHGTPWGVPGMPRVVHHGTPTTPQCPRHLGLGFGLELGLGFHGMPWRSVVCRGRCHGRFCSRWCPGMSRKRTTMYIPHPWSTDSHRSPQPHAFAASFFKTASISCRSPFVHTCILELPSCHRTLW